jgi:hypothetical protein
VTQSEAGLFAVSAAFGLGFGGISPAYVVAIRDLFPAPKRHGACRPCCSPAYLGWPFAAGSPARFMIISVSTRRPSAGALFNIANLCVIGSFVVRHARQSRPAGDAAPIAGAGRVRRAGSKP